MRQLRSLPPKHELTAADYQTFASILSSALSRDDSATSALSSVSLRCFDGRKRFAPDLSRAGSNMHSTNSDTATVATAVQSRPLKHRKVEDDDEEYSMACGMLMASPEE